jgi:hypothetical protein
MVSISTTALSLTPALLPLPRGGRWFWLALAALLFLLTATAKKTRRWTLVLGLLALAFTLWACGGIGAGGGSRLTTDPGTPVGTYDLTVTGSATSGSVTLTHSVTLELIVT